MAECAAEAVAGAEPADDLDRHGRDERLALGGGDEHAVASELDDRQLQAPRDQHSTSDIPSVKEAAHRPRPRAEPS